MNFKTNKDIIIRVVKNFLGVTAVGGMILLICFILFAESVVFSKEVIGLLIGFAILCLGIGGLISAILIFFNFCTKRIAKLERAIDERDKIIAAQNNKLRNSQPLVTVHESYNNPQTTTSDKSTGKGIFDVIEPLSDDIPEVVAKDESVDNELPEQEVSVDSNEEPILLQDSLVSEDV